MNRKLLSSLLIGAFVFGLGAGNIQPVYASGDKVKDRNEQMLDGDGMTHRVPPDRNNGDNSNRPTSRSK